MNVRELLDVLATFDPDMPVVVSGYEGGYDDPKPLRSIDVVRRNRGFMGMYDDYEVYGWDVDINPAIRAVAILR